jgi:hypothetical protein
LPNPRSLNPRPVNLRIRNRSIPNHAVRSSSIPSSRRHLPKQNAGANTSSKGAPADSGMTFREKIVCDKIGQEKIGQEKTGRRSIGRRRSSISTLPKIVRQRTSAAMPAIGFAAIKICRRNSSAVRSRMIGSSEGCHRRSNTGC